MGSYNVFFGGNYGLWSQYKAKDEAKDLPDTVVNKGVMLYYAVGVAEKLDISISIPAQQASIGDEAPDIDMFKTTTGIGQASTNLRYLLFQEGGSLPITISATSGLRVGTYHAESRSRLTNIGEGSIDIGGGLLMGKVQMAGRGFLWVDLSAVYWKRIPSTFAFGEYKFPGDDINYNAEAGYSFHPKIGLAGVIDGYQRMSGVDYPSLINNPDIPEQEQWTALKGAQLKAGGKLNVYATNKLTLSASALLSVYSVNNPVDEKSFGIGLSFYQPPSI